ncbi:MAG: hypothetical protein HFH67_11625 [Lachnospiraceae bacterium]|nr:hypothetical protein [Lachnospiraceae bacterium]
MEKKLYSDPRWWDNPMPKSSLCPECIYWQGFLKCDKYEQKVPMEVLDKSFPGTENFDENYCPYRTEKTT